MMPLINNKMAEHYIDHVTKKIKNKCRESLWCLNNNFLLEQYCLLLRHGCYKFQ